MQEALDARETYAVGSGEGGGGGAFAVGGDQIGDVVFIEAVAQAPRMLRARSRCTYRVGAGHGVVKQQVSGLDGVRGGRQGVAERRPDSPTRSRVDFCPV